MTDWLERAKEEEKELQERSNRLNGFLMDPSSANIDPHARNLLNLQATAMASYHQILRMRIKLEETERAKAQPA